MSAPATGTGLKRLQHLVLWVSNVQRSVRFYCDVVGFEVQRLYPNAAFLKIPGTPDDHHLGLFEQTGVTRPDERVARMYHSAWEVGDLVDLARARQRLAEAGALVGSSDHGVSLSLYAKDPDGLRSHDGTGPRRRARPTRHGAVLTRTGARRRPPRCLSYHRARSVQRGDPMH